MGHHDVHRCMQYRDYDYVHARQECTRYSTNLSLERGEISCIIVLESMLRALVAVMISHVGWVM